jgi:hypothetical protein
MIDALIALLTIVASLVLLDFAAARFGVESRHGLDPREPPRRNI